MLLQLLALLLYMSLFYFIIWFIVFFGSRAYSSIYGAPYVPTKSREIKKILAEADLHPGMHFLEPGCGDGRVVIEAVRSYKVQGTGIDINPLLIRDARKKAGSLEHCHFKTGNIHDIDYTTYDCIYLYLLPELIETMRAKIEAEVRPGSLVISHWFVIPAWKEKLEKTIKAGKYQTYYYRM